jgi:hypothetical protein
VFVENEKPPKEHEEKRKKKIPTRINVQQNRS